MLGIIGIITLLIVLGLSLVITRIATRALTMTGLSAEAAKFQARSAFTGTGFTTSESENVVTHPVRRQIVTLLMILRSAGLVSIIISLILSFMTTGDEKDLLIRLLWLIAGVMVLWILAGSRTIDVILSRLIEWALARWTNLDTRDYGSLLKLSGPYEVQEMKVRPGDWLAHKSLGQARLNDEGVTVLGIVRNNGDYVGAPRADTEIFDDDTLILYGRKDTLNNLDTRTAGLSGDQAHVQAVDEQDQEIRKQKVQEQQHRKQQKETESTSKKSG